MKALILAAGVGKRLSPYTDYSPKCLIDIRGVTLMERMLRSLKKVGVREVFVVVGHLKGKIKERLGSSFEGLSIFYIENGRYLEGSVLSLWAARDVLKEDDFLVMDADVLFPIQALERLLRSHHKNCFLLDEGFSARGACPPVVWRGSACGGQDSAEEMKLGVREGLVYEIARSLSNSYELIGEGVGFLKVARASLAALKTKLEEFYKRGRTACEYEELLNEWMKSETVGYERVSDLPWREIDFIEDLKAAWFDVLPKVEILESSRNVRPLNRRISKFVTKLLLKTPLSPNQITALSLFAGLLGVLAFAWGGYGANLAGALFFQAFYILDNCDGEVARAKGASTPWGAWFDISCDAVIHILLFPAIALGLYRCGASRGVVFLGILAAIGVLATFSIFMAKRVLKKRAGISLHLEPRAPKEGLRILEYFKAGDFSFLILGVALLNIMGLFLWISAIGLHLFWISALLFNLEETPVG